MGSTIIRRLLNDGAAKKYQLSVSVRRKTHAEAFQKTSRQLKVSTDSYQTIEKAEIVIFCVKPHKLTEMLQQLKQRSLNMQGKLLISIAAGVKISHMRHYLGKQAAVVRAMPNTPSLIGEGTTVLSYGDKVSRQQKKIAEAIFSCLGSCLELSEDHQDSVTGLSASGVAFAYVMIEALADGGVMRGLPRNIAVELAARTLLGASRMVIETGRHPASLKDDVTTPAGCTIGALLHLEDGRLRSVLARAVEQASEIAGTLAIDDGDN